MEHKVGDRVRVKRLIDEPDIYMLSGELGEIGYVHPHFKYTIKTRRGSGILSESQFINLEHLNESQKFQPLEELSKDSDEKMTYEQYKEIQEFFDSPKQVSFNFTLPIETYEADLHFEIDGKEYSVMITRTK